jgi:CRP-like cAMP-binding protein
VSASFGPGDLIGYSSLVVNSRSRFDLKAVGETRLGILPRSSVVKITEEMPSALSAFAGRLSLVLPPVIQAIDLALEWKGLVTGEKVWNAGDLR